MVMIDSLETRHKRPHWIHRCAFCKLCKYDYNRFDGRGDNGARTLAFRERTMVHQRTTYETRWLFFIFFCFSFYLSKVTFFAFIFRFDPTASKFTFTNKELFVAFCLLVILLIIAMPQQYLHHESIRLKSFFRIDSNPRWIQHVLLRCHCRN